MRFRALDGWRGLAALLVALYHLEFLNHFYDTSFLRNSYLFVDFFFVLSGFVITHAYQNKLNNKDDFIGFILKRVARLWPLHLFVISLFISLEFLKLFLYQSGGWSSDTVPFTGQYSLVSLISNFFLVHSLGIHDSFTWNDPSWSISVEFYTYLVFIAVISISLKYKQFINIPPVLLILAGFYILYSNMDSMIEAPYTYGLYRCIPSFFLGSLCYKLFFRVKNKTLPMASFIEITTISAIFFFIVLAGANKYSLFAPLIFTITVFVFSFEQGAVSKLLKLTIIQNLGKWSYSIYMLHAFILLIIGRSFNVLEKVLDQEFTTNYILSSGKTVELLLIKNPYLMDLLTLLYLVVLTYTASLTYKYIEMKGGKLFRKLSKDELAVEKNHYPSTNVGSLDRS